MKYRPDQFGKETHNVEKRGEPRMKDENTRHKTAGAFWSVYGAGSARPFYRPSKYHKCSYRSVKEYTASGIGVMDDLTYLEGEEYEEEMVSFKQ
ncbi:hypothetical protein TWF694_008463 [Orbilia ellipsospora]|uniref:Uncharacterized protein n=1 Tax=Orbilia ellipsospora TaxID=2528407 RepID=A0AAV9XJL2_9PEZI